MPKTSHKSKSNENKALKHLRAQLRRAKAMKDWKLVERLEGAIQKIEDRRESS